jgi:tetratricopeptide (TPR) repeat protein
MERITELIQHPERLDRDTLYELRSLCALYPYYQTARLLMLQNLYLLHDPTFDEELRRAAIYITDRRVLFDMIEASHYQLKAKPVKSTPAAADQTTGRTMSLIDSFLDSIPKDEEEPAAKKRKPTPADAAIDYVAYLLDTADENELVADVPEMPGQQLIDSFINSDKPKFVLSDAPVMAPLAVELEETAPEGVGEEYFTETLARIYIKQGRYSKALEIIQRLSLQFPKKNAYFADQIRFLEKLIINNNIKNK